MKGLTKEDKIKYEQKLIELCKIGAWDSTHGRADEILCEILTKIGYKKIVTLFNNIEKWYG